MRKYMLIALAMSCVGSLAAAQGVAMVADRAVQPVWCDGGCGTGCYDDGCALGNCGDACYGGCCDDYGCCDLGCADDCDYGEFFFNFDATFLKFHQSGGVKSVNAGDIVSDDDAAEFDFELAPRFSAGYRGPNNLGIRASYWMIDDTATTLDGDGFVNIAAQTFDVEVFKRMQVGCSSYLEASAGFRAAEFKQRDDSDLHYEVDGTGLTFALEASHHCGYGHRLYARGRTSIVMGDTELLDEGDLDDDVGVGIDNTLTQLEIAAGWEGRTCIGCGTLVYGAGVELQQWFDTVITADSSSEAYLSDGGFGGFTLRCGYEF